MDRITPPDKSKGGITIPLMNVQMQVALFDTNWRPIPRFCLGRIHAAKKNHGITDAMILEMDNRGIGIWLNLPLGERAASRGIGPNQKRTDIWNLALPNHLPPNDATDDRVEVVRQRRQWESARNLGLRIGPTATSGYSQNEAQA